MSSSDLTWLETGSSPRFASGSQGFGISPKIQVSMGKKGLEMMHKARAWRLKSETQNIAWLILSRLLWIESSNTSTCVYFFCCTQNKRFLLRLKCSIYQPFYNRYTSINKMFNVIESFKNIRLGFLVILCPALVFYCLARRCLGLKHPKRTML